MSTPTGFEKLLAGGRAMTAPPAPAEVTPIGALGNSGGPLHDAVIEFAEGLLLRGTSDLSALPVAMRPMAQMLRGMFPTLVARVRQVPTPVLEEQLLTLRDKIDRALYSTGHGDDDH